MNDSMSDEAACECWSNLPTRTTEGWSRRRAFNFGWQECRRRAEAENKRLREGLQERQEIARKHGWDYTPEQDQGHPGREQEAGLGGVHSVW